MILVCSVQTVMHKSLIIFNGNLKTRMTRIEMAFTSMPSGSYSGLCSDSSCQLGLLTPLHSAQRRNEPTREPTPTSSIHLSHQTNSHPRGRQPIVQQTPAQPSDSLAGQATCALAPVLLLTGHIFPKRRQMAPYLCLCFYLQNLKAHFDRFAAP